ncbi:MAG: (Fe-S)-binding protein [Thermoflexaceae bacterium]|nr:(Fe-S)-binding protein [Thermoflexaceae bacterium]
MEALSRCVHCGLCVTSCPTYMVTGLETESPRGRIYLARAVSEGRLAITPAVQAHWDLCLQCRACEAVCPSSVPYGQIIEKVRAQTATRGATGRWRPRMRRLLLRHVVGRQRSLAVALAPVRLYARFPLRGLVRRTGVLRLLGRLGQAEAQLPSRPGPPFRPGQALSAPADPRGEALLFTGCVMAELFGEVHRATGRVLARNGIAARAPRGQVCCGALHAHDGDLEFARRLARRNIEAFEREPGLPVVLNSAGCGAAMKEYGALLADDPRFAERARRLAARVTDLTELLASLGSEVPARFHGTVTFQDPCHLAHAQRITAQPRQLLRGIEGCDLRETPGADSCCGAAGIYGLVQPAMSAALRSRKAQALRDAAPDAVVTANPGCQLQLQAAAREAGLGARVLHIAELLDEAYRRADGTDRAGQR